MALVKRPIKPTPATLAFTAVCHICEKTYVSAIRRFQTPYICGYCAEGIGTFGDHVRYVATHPRCRNGHAMWGPNIYVEPSTGKRRCRLCLKKKRATRYQGVHSDHQ